MNAQCLRWQRNTDSRRARTGLYGLLVNLAVCSLALPASLPVSPRALHCVPHLILCSIKLSTIQRTSHPTPLPPPFCQLPLPQQPNTPIERNSLHHTSTCGLSLSLTAVSPVLRFIVTSALFHYRLSDHLLSLRGEDLSTSSRRLCVSCNSSAPSFDVLMRPGSDR
jgi:hypothetical protein